MRHKRPSLLATGVRKLQNLKIASEMGDFSNLKELHLGRSGSRTDFLLPPGYEDREKRKANTAPGQRYLTHTACPTYCVPIFV